MDAEKLLSFNGLFGNLELKERRVRVQRVGHGQMQKELHTGTIKEPFLYEGK